MVSNEKIKRKLVLFKYKYILVDGGHQNAIFDRFQVV